MDYNTSREKLHLPEYGRNIQMMINHAVSLESKEERTKAAETIIQVMGNMNPQLKDNRDYKHKLWDHLHIISQFNLDIETPFEPPAPEELFQKPDRIAYPGGRIKFMHYGKIVELMIEKALEMEAGDSKDNFVYAIANHMKLAYVTWNKDSVPDEVVFKALHVLSDGKLSVQDGLKLAEPKEPPKPQNSNHSKKKKGKQHHPRSSR